ncbi:hypothetical protein KMZ29_09900 [Bradyrhizobium sediminis]|uniref:Uncharacterized protein n=1 Tax=Bradyrhizobium sediminis TaxID=2840469 RepID=A0A975RNP6_9BRAD|nr:hypothetical protein [Bradyrhizobium sediminis]QWG14937.1 hypothetical protein KMZ29_09900 [Bradyrhizobium sediminis]
MQLAKVLPCLVLVACLSVVEDLPPREDPAPFLSTSVQDLKKAAAEAKLAEPLEVAGPIAAHPISSAPWIICLRSGATEQSKQRVYSVFFKDSRYDSMRLSAIVDRCEAQSFLPLRDERHEKLG